MHLLLVAGAAQRLSQMAHYPRVLADLERSGDDDGGSLLERALKNQLGVAREKLGRKASNMFLIVDALQREEHRHSGLNGL